MNVLYPHQKLIVTHRIIVDRLPFQLQKQLNDFQDLQGRSKGKQLATLQLISKKLFWNILKFLKQHEDNLVSYTELGIDGVIQQLEIFTSDTTT